MESSLGWSHSVWNRDSHKGQLWRRRGTDVDNLRSLSIQELGKLKVQQLTTPPYLVRASFVAWGSFRNRAQSLCLASWEIRFQELPAGCGDLLSHVVWDWATLGIWKQGTIIVQGIFGHQATVSRRETATKGSCEKAEHLTWNCRKV
jgi:hypothetical protein